MNLVKPSERAQDDCASKQFHWLQERLVPELSLNPRAPLHTLMLENAGFRAFEIGVRGADFTI